MMAAFCVYVVILSLYLHARDADSRNASSCYGAMLHLSCNTDNEVIALDNIYAVAKKKSSNCPPGGSQSCCETFVNDCKINYTGLSVSDYHKACSGSSQCQMQAAWQTTASCGSDFLSTSTKMEIEYHCVETSNSNASVELRCGLSAPPTAPSVSSCPDTSTTRVSATENLTTALPNVQENTDATTMIIDVSSKPKQSTSPHGGMSLAAAAGTGIGVVVSVMLLPILLCVLYKKKYRLMKIGSLELADSLSITGTDISTTAPSSSRLAPN